MALQSITKDELRERVDLLAVIGRHVRLQKAGLEHRGLCPFHTEKTPSFYVNPEKGLWYCRGACGTGGDVFRFVMLAEKLDFREAAELLANQLGFTLQTSQSEVRRADRRDRLGELLRLTAELYERALWNGEGGAVAREYLTQRGLTPSISRQFRLGYAPPGWDSLTRYLQRQGLSLADAEEAGLLKRRERGEGWYDRFRARVMFPIVDPQGRVVGFGGRVIDPHDEPKYLNSPESEIFNKRRLLYGLPHALDHLGQQVLVVEGYMDVIALHQHGQRNAVATLGTSLTGEHLRLLRRHTAQVVLCYDGDKAGVAATERAAAAFIEEGVDGRVLSLPGGQDPDDYLRSAGSAAFAQLLQDPPDLVDYRLRAALAASDGSAGGQQEAVLAAVTAVLADITDAPRQAQLVQRVAEWWAGQAIGLQEEFERTLTRTLRQRRGTVRGGARQTPRAAATAGRGELVAERLLAVLVQQPILVTAASAAGEQLVSPVHRELFAALAALPPGGDLAAALERCGEAASVLAARLACEPAETAPLQRLLDELACEALERQAAELRARREGLASEDFDELVALSRQLTEVLQNLERSRQALLRTDGMR
ncbi:MAG: DNA primase [Fimbriimonadaceae bacterium]|nr:DNA primase [Fimbriimonadaceae bacterium]